MHGKHRFHLREAGWSPFYSSVLVICFELDVLCHKHSYITQIFSFEIRSYQSICFTLFTELLFFKWFKYSENYNSDVKIINFSNQICG